MELPTLGGTAWLGREVARQAHEHGHAVTCLARGERGPLAESATLIAADRRENGAYDRGRGREWDAVREVSWQPGPVRGAVAALADHARHWTHVSSCSVYASQATPGAHESAELLAATELDEASRSSWRTCWRGSANRVWTGPGVRASAPRASESCSRPCEPAEASTGGDRGR